MTSPRVVVVAATGEGGERGKSDGALANTSEVARLLRDYRDHPRLGGWWLTLVEAVELRIEHAIELAGSDLALFLTEDPKAREPLEFRRIEHHPEHRIDAEGDAASPEDVLHTLHTLGHRMDLPSCYALVLRSRPAPSGDGAGRDDPAAELLFGLLLKPDPQHWDEKARQAPGHAPSAVSSSRTRAPAAN